MNATTTTTAHRRPTVGARRAGYVVAGMINAVLAFLINVEPGWSVLGFLTADTSRVLPLVNLSLVAGIATNVIYLVHDSPPVKALGELVTTGIGLAATIRIWQVFPFDFAGYPVDWAWLIRVLLVIAFIGGGIGLLVQVTRLASTIFISRG
jgi:hypothetical protein